MAAKKKKKKPVSFLKLISDREKAISKGDPRGGQGAPKKGKKAVKFEKGMSTKEIKAAIKAKKDAKAMKAIDDKIKAKRKAKRSRK